MESQKQPLVLRSALFYVFPLLFIFGIILLAGGTLIWAKGIMLIVIGSLMLFNPPSYSLGKKFDFACLGIVFVAVLAFLPADLFPQGQWRDLAVNTYGLTLPSSLTINPLKTFELLIEISVFICWFYWCCSQVYTPIVRREIICALSFLITFLAIGVIVGTIFNLEYFWVPYGKTSFSYFPNRNQTGTLLAIGAIISLGLTVYYAQRRKLNAFFYGINVLIIFFSITYNLSRAALISFAFGCCVLVFIKFKKKNFFYFLKIGIPITLLCSSLLFTFGANTLSRVRNALTGNDFRFEVYSDAISMIKDHFLIGVGLGNFSEIFTQYRDRSIVDAAIAHPESDFFWYASELGLLGLFFILFLVWIVIKTPFPVRSGVHGESVRAIALSCFSIFLLNTIVDVPAHAPGMVLLVCFIYSLSLNGLKLSRSLAKYKIVFRVFGSLFLITGCAWIYNYSFNQPLHSRFIEKIDIQLLTSKLNDKKINIVDFIENFDSASKRNPMNWRHHHLMALAYLAKSNDLKGADKAFEKVRFIEPAISRVAYEEGLVWLQYYEYERAYQAFRRAILLGPSSMGSLEMDIQRHIHGHDEFHYYGDLAKLNPSMYFNYLLKVSDREFLSLMKKEAAAEVSFERFSKKQIEALFERWASTDNTESFLEFIKTDKESKEFHWYYEFLNYGNRGDFKKSLTILKEHVNKPETVALKTHYLTDLELEERYYLNPGDLLFGFELVHRYSTLGDLAKAREIVDNLYNANKHSLIVIFWKTELLELDQRYDESWKVWRGYVDQHYKKITTGA